MGNQAIYLIHEKGKTTGFAAHYGANALSPLWRMLEAQQLQFELGPHLSITHLFEHLDYEGNYQNPRLADEDMFCRRIPDSELSSYNEAYKKGSLYEMRVLFELDKNGLQMEYNPNCPWYRTMGYHVWHVQHHRTGGVRPHFHGNRDFHPDRRST